jgi:SAM-dependent methyltransferase
VLDLGLGSGTDVFCAAIQVGAANLSPVKHRVFAEMARVLRPGGRLAIADIVSGRRLKERTRRNVELWAACIAGAIPRDSYLSALEAAGFRVTEVRTNDYDFISTRPRRVQHLRRREHLVSSRKGRVTPNAGNILGAPQYG